MPKVVEKKKRRGKSKKQRSKISQKVIQNVIVKVGEERKARKARRKQRRINRADLEAIQEQQINARVAPMVVYQTAAPFQAPQQIGQSFQQTASNTQSKENPRYLEIEPNELEFITRPSKKEQLTQFIDPVAEATNAGEDARSAIYTKQVFPKEKVQGNYAFGKFDEGSSDTSSIRSVSGITQPASRVKSLGEWINENGTEARYANEPIVKMERIYEPVSEASFGVGPMPVEQNPLARKPRRTRGETITAYRDELKALMLKEGIPDVEAEQYSNVPSTSKEFKEAIRLQKLRLKALKIRKEAK
jgi:hypothetical protein